MTTSLTLYIFEYQINYMIKMSAIKFQKFLPKCSGCGKELSLLEWRENLLCYKCRNKKN